MPRVKKLQSGKVHCLDLHGKTTSEAEELVSEAISRAIMRGESRLHIIHGFGTGKVKQTVHQVLGTLDVVKKFEISRENQGMTVVYL